MAIVFPISVPIPTFREWSIINNDTGEELGGQFEATNVTRNVGVSYAESVSVGQQHPVLQFLHGQLDTLSFTARLYRKVLLQGVIFGDTPSDMLEKLVGWARVDPAKGRPPIVLVSIGDGDKAYGDATSVITSISDINYDSPTFGGGFRGATFRVNLKQYKEFTFTSGPLPETRYHRAKAGESFESIAGAEYGDPMAGVLIRRRHPDLQEILPGQIIRLPSAHALRGEVIAPTSIAFSTMTSARQTPQQLLRDRVVARRSGAKISTVIPASVV